MKKMKKIMLSFALAISTLALVSVSSTQQASAAYTYEELKAMCNEEENCVGTASLGMLKNQEALRGFTKLEIRSGFGIVSITQFGNVKAIKSGQAILNAYDSKGKYLIYEINVN